MISTFLKKIFSSLLGFFCHLIHVYVRELEKEWRMRAGLRERQTKTEGFVQGFPQGEAAMCKILFRTSNLFFLGCTSRAKLFIENQFVNV